MNLLLKRMWCVCLAGGLFLAVAGAQVITGTISGTVRDATGAIIPGARVTATNTGTGILRSATSDSSGRYVIPQLNPGTYSVSAATSGFTTELKSGLELTVGKTTVVDFELAVGAVEQVVEVTAEAPVVDTTTASIEALVDRAQVENLPLNGRSFTQLATLQVGVATITNATSDSVFGGKGIRMSVAGSRMDANSFLLDGGDVNDQYNKTPGSVAGVMLGVDTVREFQVLTSNYSAEFGRVSGGVINAITRSGTNTLHGTLFEYLRNSALDARNFFDLDPLKPTVRSNPPPFKRNQFGGTLDGKIARDKAFFLVSYEGLRQRLAQTFFYKVPDNNVRLGILPNGTKVPIHSTVAPYLALWPRANSRVFGDGSAEFIDTQNQPGREDWWTARVDYKLSDADSFFVRYTFDDAENRLQRTGQLTYFPENQANRQHFATIEDTHIFSPTTLNTMRLSLNRQTGGSASEDLLPVPKNLYFQRNSVHFGGVSVSPWSRFGPDSILPIINALTSYQFSDNLTMVRGAHSLKTGVLIQRFQWNNDNIFNADGNWSFPDIARFLDGGSSGVNLSVQLPGSDTDKGLRLTLFGVYIQDDWRWKPNFTWNLGFRYEITDTMEEINGRESHFIDARRDPVISIGPMFKNPSLFNLAPRVGFAYSPGSSNRWVISGGGGIYYDQLMNNAVDTQRFAEPFYKYGDRSNFRALGLFPDSAAPAQAVPKTSRVMDYFHMKSPMVFRYNFGIQREITPSLGVRIGYVGSRSNHLLRASWTNTPDHVIVNGRVTEIRNSPRANPNFQTIRMRANDSQAFYNALQLQVNKRMGYGLMFQANYTWSKSIDDNTGNEGNDYEGSGDGAGYGPLRTLNRGLSSHDRRHVFQFNYSYEVPLGAGHTYLSQGIGRWILGDWNIQGIVSLQTGFPFQITGGGSRVSGYLIWPTGGLDLLSGMDGAPVLGGPDKYFDPSDFLRGLVPAGIMGNMPRNTIIGPGLANMDFSLVKHLPVTERVSMEFRGEFFNLLNRANFGEPDDTAVRNGAINPTAGQIKRTVNTSRQIQFGLKLRF